MNASVRKAGFALVALVALVGFGASLADQAFFHTDDGCLVELHCLACRTASVVVTTGLSSSSPVVVLSLSNLVVPTPESRPRLADRTSTEPRGPPPQA